MEFSEEKWSEIKNEIKMMLHASRDCYRNKYKFGTGRDPKQFRFDCSDGYYGEAFGVLRTLVIFGAGYFGAVTTPAERKNLKWWFEEICDEVLKEENFEGSGVCKYCSEKYGKDDSTLG